MQFLSVVILLLIWHPDGSTKIAAQSVKNEQVCQSLGKQFMDTVQKNRIVLNAVGAGFKCEIFSVGGKSI